MVLVCWSTPELICHKADKLPRVVWSVVPWKWGGEELLEALVRHSCSSAQAVPAPCCFESAPVPCLWCCAQKQGKLTVWQVLAAKIPSDFQFSWQDYLWGGGGVKEAGQQFLTLQSLLFLCQGPSNTVFICFSKASANWPAQWWQSSLTA